MSENELWPMDHGFVVLEYGEQREPSERRQNERVHTGILNKETTGPRSRAERRQEKQES